MLHDLRQERDHFPRHRLDHYSAKCQIEQPAVNGAIRALRGDLSAEEADVPFPAGFEGVKIALPEAFVFFIENVDQPPRDCGAVERFSRELAERTAVRETWCCERL